MRAFTLRWGAGRCSPTLTRHTHPTTAACSHSSPPPRSIRSPLLHGSLRHHACTHILTICVDGCPSACARMSHTHARARMHTHAHKHAQTHRHTHTHTLLRLRAHTHKNTHARTHARAHLHTNARTHSHSHTHRSGTLRRCLASTTSCARRCRRRSWPSARRTPPTPPRCEKGVGVGGGC